MEKKLKIARIVTVPEGFGHFIPFLKLLSEKKIDFDLISSANEKLQAIESKTNKKIKILTIKREISILDDFKSLILLSLKFINEGYTIVHSSTPKAGLITALAAFITRRKIRIHTFTGQRWATTTGFMRALLKFLDRVIIQLNTKCYADSPSQINFLIEEGVAKAGEVECINLGSYGGIDISRFNKDLYPQAKHDLCHKLSLNADTILLLFVGRVTKDKGVSELVDAFKLVEKVHDDVHLIIVGPYEENLDKLSESTHKEIHSNKKIHYLGFQTNPELYFSAADIFCLPSYREGFGTVVLEAAACGLCTVGTRIPGLIDSIEDEKTGLLVAKESVDELASAIMRLAKDQDLRRRLGEAARNRARKEFDSKLLAQKQWEEYQKLLSQK